MSLFEIGRVCLKIAGRDAGRKCVVIETVNDHYVIVDGNVRRKKVNVKHLEPLPEMIKIKENAPSEEVQRVFKGLGLPVWDHKSKKVAARVKKQKKKNVAAPVIKEKKAVKKVKAVKKAEAAVEATLEEAQE